MGKILLQKIGHHPVIGRPSQRMIFNQIQEGLLMGQADAEPGVVRMEQSVPLPLPLRCHKLRKEEEPDAMSEIVNNRAHHRFELAVEGHIAATYYQIANGVITFVHTEVPPELGGKGIGSKLIRGALDQVRAEGLKVVAQCPFVKAYIDKHGEYADLLKSS
jgi:uncharacterized protein